MENCFRFRCLVLADSGDTKNIMSVSPSEHDSWSRDNNGGSVVRHTTALSFDIADDYPRMLSPKEYHSWTAEKINKKSESFSNSYKVLCCKMFAKSCENMFKETDCDSREKSKLMENEVASPVDEVDESTA